MFSDDLLTIAKPLGQYGHRFIIVRVTKREACYCCSSRTFQQGVQVIELVNRCNFIVLMNGGFEGFPERCPLCQIAVELSQ